MKGFIKISAIDGWLDKDTGITTVYLSSGIALNVPTKEWMRGWETRPSTEDTIHNMIHIRNSNNYD